MCVYIPTALPSSSRDPQNPIARPGYLGKARPPAPVDGPPRNCTLRAAAEIKQAFNE